MSQILQLLQVLKLQLREVPNFNFIRASKYFLEWREQFDTKF